MAGEGGNITRNVFGKSYKEAESIFKDASKGALDFKSPNENTFYGKKGGKKFDEYQAKKNNTLLVIKVEGPYDPDTNKKVDFIKKEKWYNYKVIEFSRNPQKFELKKLKWAIQYDDGEIIEAPNIMGLKEISCKVSKEKTNARFTVYAYFTPSQKVSIISFIEGKYPKLYISTTKTGYTVQKLYGHPAAKGKTYSYEPGVIVETYKAFLKFFENGETKDIVEFNVTRDAWYYLGEKDKKVHILNRTFEPKAAEKNLYLTEEIHFPSKAPANCKGYFLLQNKSRTIYAEPFETDVDVNGNKIGDNRKKTDEANNVMLHIGGVYKAGWKGVGWEWLGGSLGCFAFIPANDIYSTYELAKKASENDDYDDNLSNSHWLKITNKIKELRDKDVDKRFFIIINKRQSWTKKKEIESSEVLKE